MFTMQRYLQPGGVEEAQPASLRFVGGHVRRTGHRDGTFAGRCGLPAEHAVRPVINVPELMQMFRQSADVQTAAMLEPAAPKARWRKPAIRNAPATEELKEFVQERWRAPSG